MIWKFLLISLLFGFSRLKGTDAIAWDDLRVKSGPPLTQDVNGTAFVRLPRQVSDAVRFGFANTSPTCENNGAFSGFRYRYPGYDAIVLLFDKNGIIAGLQALLPHEEVLKGGNPYRFDLSTIFQNETLVNGKPQFVLTAYFVPPATICSTGRSEASLHREGTGSGLWIQSGPTPSARNLLPIPKIRKEASREGYTDCECLPGMGLHNFWHLEEWEPTGCREAQPLQLLYNHDGGLMGFVFQIFASTSSPRFEAPPLNLIKAIIGPSRTPKCIVDWKANWGLTALHVYFIDRPWAIKCPPFAAE